MMRNLINFIMTLTGDNDYEIYLKNFTKFHKHQKSHSPLSRKEFFKTKLDQKWNKINRCC